jgi:hypothetical protein
LYRYTEDRDAPQGAVLCAGFSASGELFSCGTTMCKTHVWSLDVAAVKASAGRLGTFHHVILQ